MSEANKATLRAANAAITKGDTEGFLSFCAEDTVWTMVGEETIHGKEAIRNWLAKTYAQPPKFNVTDMIAEGDHVSALGTITIESKDGRSTRYKYCDVWRFSEGKMAELRGFAIESNAA